ncbi:MAG: insulinase family protein [Candidatus Nealsonbacteria bacterium]|nr:insulinase family protein [Candidatus Nealsonbacteria bacterium]
MKLMKKNVCLTVIAIALCSLATVATAAEPPRPADPAPAAEAEAPGVPEFKAVRKLPGQITMATLSNGLTVIVQENHVAPVATVRCYVKNTGSAYEGRYLGAGISHVLEHVVSGGTTTKRTEKEIEKIIDTFGGATNAFTSTNMTGYFIDCPAKQTMRAIDLVADAMQHVKFEPSEFARELKVVRRELADGEVNRQRVQWSMLSKTIYTQHPIRHPIIGYIDVLNATSNETIEDFYRSRYVPNNQIFVVVGDVDTQAVLDEIARQWTGTPRGRETLITLPEEPEQLSPREAVREMDGSTYSVTLAWPTVKLSHRDLYALDVAAYILAEGDSSRLVRRIKYEQQLVLSIGSASYTPAYARGFFAVMANAQPDKWQQASDEIVRDVYRLREELVAPAELAKAKKQKAAELVFGQQTVQSAAESLGRNYLSSGDPLFDHAYVKNIQQVTAEQIRDVARRYFVPGRLNRIIIAPPGGAPERTGAEAAGGEGNIRAVRLENGLRVLIKRHAQLPMVNLQAFVLAGSLVDSEATAGRSALVGAMLDKGIAGRSAQQIAQYFDSIGGQFGTGAGRNTAFGSVTTLREDFPEAAALFAECFTRPTFPEDEFKKMQTLALGAIARRADSPQGEIFELFYDNLPAGSPYHLLQGGKKETVERLAVEDLRKYHAKYFVPNNMIVTVFGDVDEDEALKLVKRHFGGLKPDPDFKPIDFNRDNAIPKTIARHKQTGKPTGMILMGYPGTGILDKRDHAAMTVLDAIMSGYSYPGGWLHNELRGEGLVYFVHAMQIAGPAPGFFAVMCQTQPEKIDEVVGRIRQNVARAREGKITAEEFRTALQMITALHAQANTTIAAQARQAALDDLYGLGYDYDKTFDARIEAVTLEDVVRVAKKYLNHHVLVTLSPAEK